MNTVRTFCFKCTREFYSGKIETFYVTAGTKEQAYKKAVKENPKCYVKVVKSI